VARSRRGMLTPRRAGPGVALQAQQREQRCRGGTQPLAEGDQRVHHTQGPATPPGRGTDLGARRVGDCPVSALAPHPRQASRYHTPRQPGRTPGPVPPETHGADRRCQVPTESTPAGTAAGSARGHGANGAPNGPWPGAQRQRATTRASRCTWSRPAPNDHDSPLLEPTLAGICSFRAVRLWLEADCTFRRRRRDLSRTASWPTSTWPA
jgi:hypothetical protein